MGEEAPPDHKIMSQWTMLFSGAGRPYLLFGRMLHPPKLDVETVIYDGHVLPAILHNAFRAPDGTEAVIAVNITNEKRKGLLDWKGKKTPIELDGWEVRLEK